MGIDNKYTVLLMRDDTPVRRLRFSPFWLKFFGWTLFFLVVIASAGSWGTYYFWQKERALDAHLVQLERNNSDLSIKLERLQNMETLIGASESTPLDPVLDTGPTEATPRDESAPGGVHLNDLPALVDASANATAPEDAVNATEPAGENFTNSTAPENAEPVVKLENINLRANSSKTLRLSISFVNTTGKSIRGYASLSLVTPEGVQAVTIPADDLDFQMARMKRATTTFPLPEGVNMDDVEAVRITVFVDEVEILSQDTPLAR